MVQLKMFQLFLYENFHLLPSSGRYNGIRERINNFFITIQQTVTMLCKFISPAYYYLSRWFFFEKFHGDKMHQLQQTEISDAMKRKA